MRHLVGLDTPRRQTLARNGVADLVFGEARPQVRAAHAVRVLRRGGDRRRLRPLPCARGLGALSGLVEMAMPDAERDTKCAAGITSRGLHPDLLERALAKNAAVAHAV